MSVDLALFAAGKDFSITRALSDCVVGVLVLDLLRLRACLKKIRPNNLTFQLLSTMEITNFELITHVIDPSRIQLDYYDNDKIYYYLEKTAAGEEIWFYNPEFAFERQHLENADATKLFSYLKIKEQYPQQYDTYQHEGVLYIRMDTSCLSPLVRHIFK